ncbi:MAG: hypothetical protein IKJ01_09105 [Lachnospiraceae bacterium]|nr:hypothetical protein [Lachnospiraceae bacterium]
MKERQQINIEKGDGKPYLKMLQDEFHNMTEKEKEEVEEIGKTLNEIFGIISEEV